MSAHDTDTISAIATAPGRGSIGVVRVSGPLAAEIAAGLTGGLPEPRRACHRRFLDGQQQVIDSGLALYFPAPDSFTGEDVLELQGHGGREVLRLLHQRTLELGARNARPGEFSERAFLNDKIDLVQAEAIADLIDAASTQAARCAVRTLQGAFSQRVHELVNMLTRLRVNVEAAIDFSDEDIDVLESTEVKSTLASLQALMTETRQQAGQGALLNEGIQVVIAGRPNAGKSSLLNALAGTEAAIVTDTPGTTRDLLNADIQADGLPLRLTDTAGLRHSTDPVEQEGIRRAREAIVAAEQVLLLIDGTVTPPEQISEDTVKTLLEEMGLAEDNLTETASSKQALLSKATLIVTKIDLLPQAEPQSTEIKCGDYTVPAIHLSAKTGQGTNLLQEHLASLAGFQPGQETVFAARSRHLEALDAAAELMSSATSHVSPNKETSTSQNHGTGSTNGGEYQQPEAHGLELMAEDLRLAQQALGQITGEFTADDLLGEIFSSFCIGK